MFHSNSEDTRVCNNCSAFYNYNESEVCDICRSPDMEAPMFNKHVLIHATLLAYEYEVEMEFTGLPDPVLIEEAWYCAWTSIMKFLSAEEISLARETAEIEHLAKRFGR